MKTIPITINRICEILNITESEYINQMYTAGNEYLDIYETDTLKLLPKKSTAAKRWINRFRRSSMFWCWWCIETEARDRSFLRFKYKSATEYTEVQRTGVKVPPESVLNEILAETNPAKSEKYHLNIKVV